MSSNIRDLQIIIATRLYNQNTNITSREMAKSLPNSSGGYGIRLQSAQQIIREIKNVPVNPKMVLNPYGQKGKPIIIEDKTKEKEKRIIADNFNIHKPLNIKINESHRLYKYYLAVESIREFYPVYEPVTDFITYGFNTYDEYRALKEKIEMEYHYGINNGSITYWITDGYNDIAEYEIN